MPTDSERLDIGGVIFAGVDQSDFTGPFEVLSRLPGSTFHVLAKEKRALRDVHGLILTPEEAFSDAPKLDVLVVPGGPGQEALMEDDLTLSFIRSQAANARFVFSVCTGALLCGAAGLLRGVRATTHWSAIHLLPYFGAIPVDARVAEHGKMVSAAGVTAGLDGALRLAALLCGDRIAQQIQLAIQYAPSPPFACGTPGTASPEVLEDANRAVREITEARLATAIRVAARLGIDLPAGEKRS
jgi:cyclohexyl-isocyanide hydratase